jgi:prevent-host-death family protein
MPTVNGFCPLGYKYGHGHDMEAAMKSVPVVEAKAHFSALLAAVEAGEEIALTRRGKVIARLVPDHPRKAADAFRDFWSHGDETDLIAPGDDQAERVTSLDI